jgi:hypothetical protein
MADFFISYTGVDKPWAEWIGWTLETEGFETILQAWDFLPGQNFVLAMQDASTKASRTIPVLSPEYLKSGFANSEWAAAFARDPSGVGGRLLPVRVRECSVVGLLAPISYIDIIGLDEPIATKALLDGARGKRRKPVNRPVFPGRLRSSSGERPLFPGARGGAFSVETRPDGFMPRIRQAYSDLDKLKYIEAAFETVFHQFESRLADLSNQYPGLQYTCKQNGRPRVTEFEVQIFISGQSRARCGIALRDQFGQPGIIYSDKGLDWSGYNDRLTVSDDPYSLALQTTFGGFGIGGINEGLDLERLSPEAGAEYLWRRLAHRLEW